MSPTILSLAIHYERDVVLARQRARQIAALLGFDVQDQTRIATAASEIARNTFNYADGGRVEFLLEGVSPPQVLMIRVSDKGPGIPNVQEILEGRYRSATGMGLGIIGARRLMDSLEIDSRPGHGTAITLTKLLPRRAPVLGPDAFAAITTELAQHQPEDAVQEIQQQNQELLRTLAELAKRQEELERLNRELEDTNRGVVALYAELDERADHLRRADELKTRFLSNMSHEFRTPVNSIQALSRMLLERTDGDLTEEQARQVGFIRKAADGLSELVGDLLDLAKVEAGKSVVRPTDFEIANLFGALRGMLKPLLVSDSVSLVFEDGEDLPALRTDEAKVSQILRNFISNALKFTETGAVRVSAQHLLEENAVAFSVSDTGIGIAPEDQDAIFQEFTQLDSPLQRRVRGTGLGLPLCRKLAELLGGRIILESEVGAGSTFTAVIPALYDAAPAVAPAWEVTNGLVPILIVEDSAESLLVYEKYFKDSTFQLLEARTLDQARRALATLEPAAIVLDIVLYGEAAWNFLAELKRKPETQGIPVVVVTSVDDERKGLALGADAYCVKPVSRQHLLHTLTRVTAPQTLKRILIVDDEEISRYLLRQKLTKPQHVIFEAATTVEALRLARDEQPHAICLDLMLPDVDGFEALRQLKADPVTRDIPVVVVTSRNLQAGEGGGALELAVAVLGKSAAAREAALATVEGAIKASERAA